MKKNKLKAGVALGCAALIAGGALVMSGCTMDEVITADLSTNAGSVAYYGNATNAEIATIDSHLDGSTVMGQIDTVNKNVDKTGQGTKIVVTDGTNDDKSFSHVVNMSGSQDWISDCYLFDKDKLAFIGADTTADYKTQYGVDVTGNTIFDIKNGAVVATNGTITGDSQATFTKVPNGVCYVVFNQTANTCKTITFSVKNGAYTNNNEVHADSRAVVTGLKLNGKAVDVRYVAWNLSSAMTVNLNGKSVKAKANTKYLAYNNVYMKKQGKNTITATLHNGTTKSITVTYDSKKPTTNVKSGKKYKKGKKVTFKDATSGVKTAKLNGKKIKSGKKIKKAGSYKLVITDKAGNKRTVKFKIKKK